MIMPKLTKQDLDKLKYVSMVDFCQKIDTYPNMDDKLRFATRYLLLHGSNGEPDCTIQEATYIAQLAIGAASLKEKNKMEADKINQEFLKKNPHIVNPHVKSEKEDLAHELFMQDPCKYLRGYAEKTVRYVNNLDIAVPDERRLSENCTDLLQNKLDVVNFTDDVYDLATKPNPVAVKLRTELRFGGKEQYNAVYEASKPSFFQRMFKYSTAAKNLDTAYKAFNNPNHALYGNKEALEKASVEYLQHKFPGWQPGDEYPDLSEHNQLSTQEKARSLLSINYLKSVDEQRGFEDKLKGVIDSTKDREISFADADRPPVNQDVFQKNIALNLDDSADEIEVEDQNDLEKSKDLDIEELMKGMVPDKD